MIHLVRNDVFAVAVSFLVAETTAIWHRPARAGQTHFQSIVVDPRTLEQMMRSVAENREHVSKLLRTYNYAIEICYEDAFGEDGGLSWDATERLSDFLDVHTRIRPETGSRKVITKPLCQLISNKDEVRRFFSGHDLEPYVRAHLD